MPLSCILLVGIGNQLFQVSAVLCYAKKNNMESVFANWWENELINKDVLSLMKSSAFIINTARGPIVNEVDLQNALENNIIAGAAIDVFSTEPAKNSILFKVPNLILTPHIAASTNEAQIIVAEMVAKQISEYFKSGKIINSV